MGHVVVVEASVVSLPRRILLLTGLCCVVACPLVMSDERSVAEKKSAEPATAADAVRVLDLSSFPLMPEAKEPVNRTVAQLSYRVPSDCVAAYEFQRTALARLKWAEVPGSPVTKQYASGMFTKEGFTASLSTMPMGSAQQPNLVNVTLLLHGNVDLGKLPVPAGAQKVYVAPQIAMYSTQVPAAETLNSCRQLLLADGWQPYGQVEGTYWFKQNAIRLTVSIMAAPAQAGRTSISYSAEQLSADVPAPLETVQLQYSDSTKQLSFDTKDTKDNIVSFYRQTLGARGWKATTDHLMKLDFREGLVFRNSEKDMFTLELHPVDDEQVLRVTLKYNTAAEMAAIEKSLAEKAAAEQMKKDQQTNSPVAGVSIALPAGAKLSKSTAKRLEFTVTAGSGAAAAEALRKQFRESGWKEDTTVAEAMVGQIAFRKGEQEISLNYVDTGFLPAEFTIDARGVDVEPAKSDSAKSDTAK